MALKASVLGAKHDPSHIVSLSNTSGVWRAAPGRNDPQQLEVYMVKKQAPPPITPTPLKEPVPREFISIFNFVKIAKRSCKFRSHGACGI